MAFKLSSLIANAGNNTQPVPAETIDIPADPSIGLEATNVQEGIVELAEDIHQINNISSLSLDFATKRNA